MPELAHLPPELLGSPPPTPGYPAPMLNYKAARQQRVKQLAQQRQALLSQANVVPYLSRLPTDLTPFGADRYASEIKWATLPHQELFPPPLDLDQLDLEQAKALRSWFVAHVDIPPRQPRRRSKSPAPPSDTSQLSLL